LRATTTTSWKEHNRSSCVSHLRRHFRIWHRVQRLTKRRITTPCVHSVRD